VNDAIVTDCDVYDLGISFLFSRNSGFFGHATMGMLLRCGHSCGLANTGNRIFVIC
jgi:hypothetical protein